MGMKSIRLESIAIYSKVGNSSGVNQRFKKNSSLVCDFCKCKGQIKEFCYKIVGYPPDFKSKRKLQGANVVGTINKHSGQKDSGPVQANFSYCVNTNVNVLEWGREPYTHNTTEPSDCNLGTKAEMDVKQLLQGCTLQKTNMIRFLKCWIKVQTSVSECNAANTTGTLHWKDIRCPEE